MRPERIVYKTVPGCEICADVYRADGAGPAPALVWIHGGCLMYGSRQQVNPDHVAAYLASGWTVAAIDYRLAPETLLPAIVEDLRARTDIELLAIGD